MATQKLVPNLWFDTEAEQAAEYYCSIFKNSKITGKTHYPDGADKAGMVLTVEWELEGQRFVGINGGPQFKFDEAVSFEITCADQDEVDYYWEKLTADGGAESMCGWVKDRFGLSWQVVPEGMVELFDDADPQRAARAFQAMMDMKKLDLAALREAADAVAAE
jgi:predicted 3-demethylubiquinone-9 3-methyltransferase (glyoxalase superfamily)